MANKMTRVETVDEVVSTPSEKEVVKKVFVSDDMIPCRSICNGEFLLVGDKTKDLYSWADYGTVENVAYADLKYLCDRRNSSVMLPRIIIEDDDFLEKYSYVSDVYEHMYTNGDLKEILNLPISQMKTAIDGLPKGILETLKGLIATMIDRHELDSVEKIKALDEIFDTKLLLTLARY